MDLLGLRKLPLITQRNFVPELWQMLLWSVPAGLIEGQFAAVVVSKTFQANQWAIAVASATPVAANLFSLLWGILIVGRPKIRVAGGIASAAVLCAAFVGLIPNTPAGALWYIVQMAVAQVLLAGVVTTRAALWRSNYPRSIRGQIAARLQGIRFVMTALTSLAGAWLCDVNPSCYRYLYPIAALAGLLSLTFLRRIRVRGEAHELREIARTQGAEPVGEVRRSVGNAAAAHGRPGLWARTGRILLIDARFRQYCVAQMCVGVANLMCVAVVVTIATRRLDVGESLGYWVSLVLLTALPRAAMLASLRRWGRVFDRLGVFGMRRFNMFCWGASVGAAGLADLVLVADGLTSSQAHLMAVGLLALRGIAQGLGEGGGAVAWYIGHMHFAESADSELYLGIHSALAGLRGLVAPLGGMWLWQTIGEPFWLIALSFAMIAYHLYRTMDRQEQRIRAEAASAGITK